MIVLVTGGRTYAGAGLIAKLDEINAVTPIRWLVHGGASGADAVAHAWAMRSGVMTKPFRVSAEAWEERGKRAGPERNQEMVDFVSAQRDAGVAVVCVAAPGGAGTADCVRRARRAGIRVVKA